MLGELLKPEIQEMIRAGNLKALHQVLVEWEPPEIANLIEDLPPKDDVVILRLLPHDLATTTFEYLSPDKQQELIEALIQQKDYLAGLLNALSPDDRTALLEELPGHLSQRLLNMLSTEEREVALRLLGYPEDSVGRLMTTDYVAVRPGWTVQQALDHIRRVGKDKETLNVIYVVDDKWHLIDDLRIRLLLLADPAATLADLMDERFISLRARDDQETAIHVFRDYDRVAVPVTDTAGTLLGIVTIDDVMDVAEEEATEDIQKIGGVEALDDPYIDTPLFTLVQKRAKWLVVLFLGEMFTTTAMGHFEDEIARAVVLTLFIPLIISSGGNSGSQAATLIIRAMSIGEITLRDWWRVMRREVLSGLALGAILGLIGILRVGVGEAVFATYGPHWFPLAMVVGISLMGVVICGTLAGSMLPFIMKRLGADPATSSAPFVATLADVAGLVIYFTAAALLLSGTLL
jgi:magnesium transporter